MRAALAVNADIDSLPFPPSALDGAAAASVLQWLASPVSALRGIARALKGGGPLCFGAFVDGAFAELVEIRARMGLPSAVWLPTASELLMVFDSAGFDVTAEGVECYESVQRFQDAAGAIGSMSRIGATAAGGRLLNRSELNRLYRDYALAFGKDGAVPITYRAVVGKARKRAD
jgi:malonyl-CoA O-methyltransferase